MFSMVSDVRTGASLRSVAWFAVVRCCGVNSKRASHSLPPREDPIVSKLGLRFERSQFAIVRYWSMASEDVGPFDAASLCGGAWSLRNASSPRLAL